MSLLKYRFILLFLAPSMICQAKGNTLYKVASSNVSFSSRAPFELINATSVSLVGVLDTAKNIFLFKMNISSFEGFNNPLQKEHFNEDYMESAQYPDAVYRGKIIENIDYKHSGTYQVRTKGVFTIHGVSHECLIQSTLKIMGQKIFIISDFQVLLRNYNIKIPRIVHNNISQQINISVKATMVPKNNWSKTTE